MKEVCQLAVQFDSFRTTKDGGGKITLEFGQDAFAEIQKILEWNTQGHQNYLAVITPYDTEQNLTEQHDESF